MECGREWVPSIIQEIDRGLQLLVIYLNTSSKFTKFLLKCNLILEFSRPTYIILVYLRSLQGIEDPCRSLELWKPPFVRSRKAQVRRNAGQAQTSLVLSVYRPIISPWAAPWLLYMYIFNLTPHSAKSMQCRLGTESLPSVWPGIY